MYPLQSITDGELQRLTQVMWNWNICQACQNTNAICVRPSCSWTRSARLLRYFDFYKDITTSYVPELLPGCKPALRGHEDIVDIIVLVRSKPTLPRAALTHDYFSRRDIKPPLADQHRAFNLVVQVMTMVKCSVENQPSGILELGTQPLPWHSDASFSDFLSKGNHLRLDAGKGIVEIYHHTSVLKEHLMHSKCAADPSTQGNVPRQVALEALDSVQKILFPFDSDSEGILRDLVSRQSFDPDCLRYDCAGYRREGEEDITYSYFGGRLMDLFEEQQDPTPHSILEKWFQRRSGARFMMMATFVGIFIAIILGVLGLAVSIVQAWLAYQAWKHPVTPTN